LYAKSEIFHITFISAIQSCGYAKAIYLWILKQDTLKSEIGEGDKEECRDNEVIEEANT
jgi:hypothetical protein